MSDQEPADPFDAIAAKLQADREAEVARFAEMFIAPAVCTVCGANVAIPSQHKKFHDDLTAAFDTHSQNVQKICDWLAKHAAADPDAS
ncbi:hypothetical protein [Nocardia sp. NPDC059228]|uniref:hypothetical protein n=1 Tax=Nocardia sp. NPDC059228 TaxID=3346777 RepID=UPI00368DA216